MNQNSFIFFLAEEKDNKDYVQMITMPFSMENNLNGEHRYIRHTYIPIFLWKLTCFNSINWPRHLSMVLKTCTLGQETRKQFNAIIVYSIG